MSVHRKYSLVWVSIVCGLGATAVACGESSSTITAPAGPPAGGESRLVVSAPQSTFVEGDTLRLEVSYATPSAVTWSSSAPDIVRVSAGGTAIAVAPGVATVKAVVGKRSASVALVVTPKPVAVEISPVPASLEPGETIGLSAAVRDRRGVTIPGVPVQWRSDDSEIVQVVSGNIVLALRIGAATLHASAGPLEESAVLQVREPVFRAVSAGGGHTCGVSISGAAYCWGENMFGQLGDSSFTVRRQPVRVRGSRRFVSVSAGSGYTCGVDAAGAVLCWGDNSMMESGAAGAGKRNTVPLISALAVPAVSVATGDMSHSCALGVDGEAYCWGYNRFGQVGEGSTVGQRFPVSVVGGVGYRQVVANGMRSCALDMAGRVSCWGRGGVAQYGETTELETCSSLPCRTTPAVMEDEVRFATLAVGYVHTCGLTAEGHAYCWGMNESGQLGIAGDSVTTATRTAGDLAFSAVSSGRSHTCATTDEGVAYCWGSNSYGELGDGTTAGRAEAMPVAGTERFADIEIGVTHSCGLTVDGRVMCWGDNAAGQVGDSSLSASPVNRPAYIRFP